MCRNSSNRFVALVALLFFRVRHGKINGSSRRSNLLFIDMFREKFFSMPHIERWNVLAIYDARVKMKLVKNFIERLQWLQQWRTLIFFYFNERTLKNSFNEVLGSPSSGIVFSFPFMHLFMAFNPYRIITQHSCVASLHIKKDLKVSTETNIRSDDVFSSPNYGQLVTLPFFIIDGGFTLNRYHEAMPRSRPQECLKLIFYSSLEVLLWLFAEAS